MVLPPEISRLLREPFGELVLDEDITKKKLKIMSGTRES
jgi:hypothetical protein